MKAQFVRENLNFERGIDPRHAVGIGMQEKLKQAMKEDGWEYRDDDIALSWAAENNHPEFVEYLIKNGANVNARQQANMSSTAHPIRNAIFGGNPDIVKMILDAGADPNVLESREMAQRVLQKPETPELLQLLLDYGLDLSNYNSGSLAQWAAQKPKEFMKTLIDAGMDISDINLFHINTSKEGGKYLLDQMSKLAAEKYS